MQEYSAVSFVQACSHTLFVMNKAGLIPDVEKHDDYIQKVGQQHCVMYNFPNDIVVVIDHGDVIKNAAARSRTPKEMHVRTSKGVFHIIQKEQKDITKAVPLWFVNENDEETMLTSNSSEIFRDSLKEDLHNKVAASLKFTRLVY